MMLGRVILGALPCLLATLLAGCSAKSPAPSGTNTATALNQHLALSADLDFRSEPLDKALARLAADYQIKIQIHPQVAKAWPGGKGPSVYFRVAGMPLGEALELLLDLHGLSLVARHDRLDVIPKGSSLGFVTRVYPLIDLLGAIPGSRADGPRDEAGWAEVVSAVVAGNWDEKADGGFVHAGPGALVVAQTEDVHQRIERFLADARRVAAGEEAQTKPKSNSLREISLRKALRRNARLALPDVTIEGLADHLYMAHHLGVTLDSQSFEPADNRVRLSIGAGWDNTPLATTLTQVLFEHNLNWRTENGILILTSTQAANEAADLDRKTRVYKTSDLIDERSGFDIESIWALVQRCVAPYSWDTVGGPCSMKIVPNGLAVLQTDGPHVELEGLLDVLRTFADPTNISPGSQTSSNADGIDPILDRRVSIDWKEQPLDIALSGLLYRHGISHLVFDRASMENAFVPVESITISLANVPLRSVLDRVLEQFDLGWTIDHDSIFVSSNQETHSRLVLRFYRLPEMPSDSRRETYLNAITTLVAPQSWERVGGPGTIDCIPRGIAVQQTPDVQRQLAEFLHALARLADPNEPDLTLGDDGTTKALVQALAQPVSIDVREQPLDRVVEELANAHHLFGLLKIDDKSFEEAGCDTKLPVTLRVRGVSLASALNLSVEPPDLGWSVSGGQIRVTTNEKADSWLQTRLYHLPQPTAPALAAALIDVIKHVISPPSWDNTGGPGEATLLPGGMAVSQTEEVQAEVRQFIERMRPILTDRSAPLLPAPRSPSAEQIERALGLPASLDVRDTPLKQVLKRLAEEHDINLVIDSEYRLPDGFPGETVSMAEAGLSLAALLDKLLLPRKLDWVIRHEVLMVTSREAAEFDWDLQLYDVRRLLQPLGSLNERELSDLVLAVLDPTGEKGLAFAAAPNPVPGWIRGRASQAWADGDLPILCGILPVNTDRRSHAALKELLFGEGDDFSRLHSLAAEVNAGTDRLSAIRRGFKDGSPAVRCYVIRAVRRLAPAEAADAEADLIGLLQDPASDVRVAAVGALAGIGKKSEKAVPALAALVPGPDERLRRAAVSALRSLGPKAAPAAPALAALARNPEWQSEALEALVAIGPAALPQLIEVLQQSGGPVAPTCAAIGQIGPAAAKAVPALLKVLSGPLIDRIAACEALAKIGDRPLKKISGPEASRALLALVELFENSTVSESGLRLFAALGPAAVPQLIKLLKQRDERTVTVCRALGEVGRPAASAVPALLAKLDDASPEIRAAACTALGEIGVSGEKVVPALLAVLQASANQGASMVAVRQAACAALGEFAPWQTSAIPALKAASADPDPSVSEAARSALEGFGVAP